MPDFDATLKIFLRRLAAPVFEQLTGEPIVEWLQPELPEIRTLRPDLVGRTPAGEIIHFEIQAHNDRKMPMREMEYALGIYKALNQWPRQIVLYVGLDPMRMADEFQGYRYRIIDVREIDAEPLLASSRLEDNVIAILFRLRDERAALRRILDRIAAAEPGKRAEAAKGLFVLAGLRKLRPMLKEEEGRRRTMDITYDWHNDPTIGPVIAEAAEKAAEKAVQQTALDTSRRVVRNQIEKRFGPLEKTLAARLDTMSLRDIEVLSLRILDAVSVDELFD